MSAVGVGTNEIMRQTGKSKTCVWRWQERFMQAGYDALLRDKTRPSRIPPLGSGIAERVVQPFALIVRQRDAEADDDVHPLRPPFVLLPIRRQDRPQQAQAVVIINDEQEVGEQIRGPP